MTALEALDIDNPCKPLSLRIQSPTFNVKVGEIEERTYSLLPSTIVILQVTEHTQVKDVLTQYNQRSGKAAVRYQVDRLWLQSWDISQRGCLESPLWHFGIKPDQEFKVWRAAPNKAYTQFKCHFCHQIVPLGSDYTKTMSIECQKCKKSILDKVPDPRYPVVLSSAC